MEGLRQLLLNNRAWAGRISEENPDFFPELAAQQTPRYLWIGCADSPRAGERDRRPQTR
jgi:carbonic anhydrase